MIRFLFSFTYLALFGWACFYLHRLAERVFAANRELAARVNRVGDQVQMLRCEIAEGATLQVDEDAEFMAIMHANGFRA